MGDIYKQKKNFRKNTNSPEAPPLGNFPCMASEVSSLSIPESMCETLLFEDATALPDPPASQC